MSEAKGIAIHVYEDGDTELIRIPLEHTSVHLSSGCVVYKEEDTEGVQKELRDYGHNEESISEAIKGVLQAEFYEPVLV